jgi:hypothetical protein
LSAWLETKPPAGYCLNRTWLHRSAHLIPTVVVATVDAVPAGAQALPFPASDATADSFSDRQARRPTGDG